MTLDALLVELKLMAGDLRNLRARGDWSEEVAQIISKMEASLRHFIVDLEMLP